MYAGDGVLDGHASSGNDGVLGANATGEVAIQTGMGTLGKHTLTSYHAEELKNKFLYLTAGAATTQKASCTIDVTSASFGNVNDAVDTIRLINSSEAAVNFVANNSHGYGAGAQANKFNIQGGSTTAHLSEGIGIGIHNNGAFTADPVDGSQLVITVTHAAVSATSNHANYLVNDDPQAPNGIVISDFTGGIDDGVAVTSGKLLIRVTGFLEPDDL